MLYVWTNQKELASLISSELIKANSGKVYHLDLRKEDISDTIILVGDQDRVAKIYYRFESIRFKNQHREFVTHTGTYRGRDLTVMSTGIGTDNIDIAINELDALVNSDPDEGLVKLTLLRLGTSGALHNDIPIGSFLMSSGALGLDGLMHYYRTHQSFEEQQIQQALAREIDWPKNAAKPYYFDADPQLMNTLCGDGILSGITATAHGFYGPQGRRLRAELSTDIATSLAEWKYDTLRITSFEMETSALYGLSKTLGHRACTICAIIANRSQGVFSSDYQSIVDQLIEYVLNKLTT
jgi:uridine phosphorylase